MQSHERAKSAGLARHIWYDENLSKKTKQLDAFDSEYQELDPIINQDPQKYTETPKILSESKEELVDWIQRAHTSLLNELRATYQWEKAYPGYESYSLPTVLEYLEKREDSARRRQVQEEVLRKRQVSPKNGFD